MDTNLVYALKDNQLIHISQVAGGHACQCVCPACGEPLCAKKGPVMAHHFAHAPGSECRYAFESALHYLAKEILAVQKRLLVPLTQYRLSVQPADYAVFPLSNFYQPYRQEEHARFLPFLQISDSCTMLHFDQVQIEKRSGSIIPDLLVYVSGQPLLIEIAVSHFADTPKLDFLEKNEIPALEINLSQLDRRLMTEQLAFFLIHDLRHKTWLYNPRHLARLHSLKQKAEYLLSFISVHTRHYPLHQPGNRLYQCPLHRDKPYINAKKVCSLCPYFLGKYKIEENQLAVKCCGKEREKIEKEIAACLAGT